MTIGYKGRNIDKFLSILIENKIGKLIDVRKNPFSMKYGYRKTSFPVHWRNWGSHTSTCPNWASRASSGRT